MPQDIGQVADLFSHYKAGHLWCAGGVADQPAVYLEIMQTLTFWVDKLHV